MNRVLKKENTIIIGLSALLLISFAVCHLTFSYYMRIESDDYTFLAWLRDKGFVGTMKFIYMNWEGAFGVLLITLPKILFAFHISLFLHQLVSTVLTFYFFYYFIKTILRVLTKQELPLQAFFLSALIYTAEYFNSLALNDSWYWLCGSIYFFMPALLLFCAALLINHPGGMLSVPAYIYFFIYGASRFNYSVIFISVICLFLLVHYYQTKKVQGQLMIILCCAMAAFIVYVLAPGNYVRRDEELKRVLHLKDYLTGPFVMAKHFIMKFFIMKAPYHAIFLLPAAITGYLLRDILFVRINVSRGKMVLYIGAFMLFCIYMQCLGMFVAKGSQASRTLEMLVIICVFCMAAICVIAGSYLKRSNIAISASAAMIFLASAFLIRRITVNFNTIKTYAQAVDERHRIINDALKNFRKDTLYLAKLPNSSWLHSGELDKRNGPNPMNNIFLEEYYHPKFFLDIKK